MEELILRKEIRNRLTHKLIKSTPTPASSEDISRLRRIYLTTPGCQATDEGGWEFPIRSNRGILDVKYSIERR